MPIQDAPHQRWSLAIDGFTYLWHLDYYARSASWYLSLYADSGDPIVLLRKLSVGWNPLVRERHGHTLPPGALYVLSQSDPIGRDGFASGAASFIYLTPAEVADIATAANGRPLLQWGPA